MYSVSSIAWKFDGSRLALGTVTGAVDLYDACIRRYRYKGKFEFTYVSLSQAIRALKRSRSRSFVAAPPLGSVVGCQDETSRAFTRQAV
jgi:hypothetical protein